jgi:hypothetical protein
MARKPVSMPCNDREPNEVKRQKKYRVRKAREYAGESKFYGNAMGKERGRSACSTCAWKALGVRVATEVRTLVSAVGIQFTRAARQQRT